MALPTWCDVEVFVVGPDGAEVPFHGVRSLLVEAREGTGPLVAKLECYVDEVDVLAEVRPSAFEVVPAPGDRCGNTKQLPDGSPCPGCRACA